MKPDSEQLKKYNESRPVDSISTACWAPAKNMFLGLRGKVMTCCYNKSYLTGTYPEQSLHSIWFGEKREAIVDRLQMNDFSLGCQGCLEAIKTGNISGLTAKKFDGFPLSDYPSRMDFELSNECNLECMMCRGEFSSSIRKNREKLPPIPSPYGPELLAELEEFIPYLHSAHFLGGEPFLIPIYLDIWELMMKLNPTIRLSITTNATLLSDRVKRILEGMNFDIGVSIDSVVKENYEQIRKNAKLEKVLENIEYLRGYCQRKGTSFHISSCVMTLNWQDLPGIIHFSNQRDTPVFFTRVSFPRELSLESLDPEKLEQVEATLRKSVQSGQTATEILNYKTLADLTEHISFWKKEAEKRKSQKINDTGIDAYFSGLQIFIQSNSSSEDKAVVFENIRSKLIYILDIAEENDNLVQAENKLMEIDYKTMLEMVPGIEKEHLLHLFEAFIMPVKK